MLEDCASFVVPRAPIMNRSTPFTKTCAKPKTRCFLSNQQFDLSKPVFDLFTFRSIRGDALLRYSTLNQSEPLRINLFGLLALSLFAFPSGVSEAVGGEPASILQSCACIVGGLGSVALFLRECHRRSRQLYRIEKELNSELLKLRLPMNALSDVPFTEPATLGTLTKVTSTQQLRIIVVSGTSMQLSSVLATLQIFGRRLRQATTFVVPVPTDGSTRNDWNLAGTTNARTLPPWLADAYEVDTWLQYLNDLAEDSNQFRWFGLNSNGRSFGSGAGQEPQWLELFGQYLRPNSILDVTDSSVVNDETRGVLDAQTDFYNALKSGDLEAMKSVCLPNPSSQVTEVFEAGGRLDDWNSCLKDGARPEGMRLSGGDAIVVSENQAFSTIIEFPDDAFAQGTSATLLAVQQWYRESPRHRWKLALHQTIPWTSDAPAQGTLRCDCRGCVALTRGAQRRTFGGIIGQATAF
jgi:hypothetical protein